jgi:hypothetical protein
VALANLADQQEMLGIQEVVHHIAVLQADPQLVRGRAIDVLGAQVLDLVAFFLPPEQRPVQVGVLAQPFDLVGGGAPGLTSALERVQAPALLGAAGVDRGKSLERDFIADRRNACARIALLDLTPGRFDRAVATAERRLAGQAQRLDRQELVVAA